MWYKYMYYKFSNNHIPIPKELESILNIIKQNGGTGFLVGGIVRDFVYNKIYNTNIPSKDYDVEVYGLSYDKLISILEQFGVVNQVGKSFGTTKVTINGNEYDFTLPRTESKAGNKHQDFNITVDKNLTPEQGLARRDLTINAMLFDPLTGNLIDPYNGQKDIKNKTLRHTSNAFSEDPLRVLRLMSLGARFDFNLAPETAQLAKSIKDQYQYLPKERIEMEFNKLVRKGIKPGKALQILRETGWDENFNALPALWETPQDQIYHPEGNVATHTAHVMNAAADIATRKNLSPEDREVLIYAALVHDFAKPQTTKTIVKNGRPTITSYDHERQGGPIARHFLESIGVNKRIIDKVVPLVENHLNHIHFSHSNKQDAFVKQLAERLHPANIQELERLVEADHSGRPPLPQILPEQMKQLSNRAKQNNVYIGKHPDLLQGKDVLNYTGGQGGILVGQILKEHRNKILNHELNTREEVLNWLAEKMKKKSSLINGNDIVSIGVKGPQVKEILDRAWQAQKAGQFNDKAGALQWLRSQNV